MSVCCRTCDHRTRAMHTLPSTPSLLDVCLITLTFKSTFPTSTPLASSTSSYTALNAVLNDITDTLEQTPHPTTFTTWSPCLSDPHKVAILTTASETCAGGTSHVFAPVLKHLSAPPSVQHIFLDYSVLTLAASSPEHKIPCDIIVLRAPTPGIAGAIGKRFGWAPKRSSLSAQMLLGAPAAFSRPGDLIRDFWAWAELRDSGEPGSPSRSSSLGSEHEGVQLKSTNSDEKNMSLFFSEDEGEDDDGSKHNDMDDETLVMIFQWSSLEAADRFKHPLQRSLGQNGQEVGPDLWDRHVAHPVRQLKGVGAQVDTLRLELRGVEERILVAGKNNTVAGVRERSGSRTLSVMATGIGERVSGFWR
ncbi:hypothetical protein K505DRAFT_407237 [Melanomma pulvis-pyrius CBS 109.77]|uniref:Uncharacterized protein n=1 Tax=Melanomma pulvis-pyrius CBS 109.77 TaxID=1314802 RepID=A0A6A6XF73_9PLEO|nr:hypothetical protein K505DRAFT_407237 [Melanomma pulvis-pyrius CBS 109.77]